VRELEHCVESAVVLAHGDVLEEDHLPLPRRGRSATMPPTAGYPAGTPLATVEQDHIHRTLAHCAGNRTEAAQLLGIGRNTLLRRLKESGDKA